MNIQWYPGHMAKAKRKIIESLKLVDVVVELVDARIPLSSRNPEIDNLANNKHRVIIFNKSDLSDESQNNKWKSYFEEKGIKVIMANSLTGKGLNEIYTVSKELMKEKIQRQIERGRLFVPIRAVVVGIPNVGKSTLINKLLGKAAAKTGDRPGVTKSNQWIKIKKDFELLDTPGILWPKFDDKKVGINLAITGAINDEIVERQQISMHLIEFLVKNYPDCLKARYGIDWGESPDYYDIFRSIGQARGFLSKGGEIDFQRTAVIFLDEFRGGVIGNITLELCEY